MASIPSPCESSKAELCIGQVQTQAKKGLGRLGPRWATFSMRHLRLLAQHRYITYNNEAPEPTITVHMKLRKPSRAARKRVHDMPGPEDEDDEERERRENRLLAEELGFGHKQRLPKYAEVCETSDRRGEQLKKLQKTLGMQVNASLMSIVDDEEDRESAVDTDISDDEQQEQEGIDIDIDIHEDEILDDPFVDAPARSESPALMTRAASVPTTLPSHSPIRQPTLALQPIRKPTLPEAAYATPVSAPRRRPTMLESPESPSARSSRGGLGALSYASGSGHGHGLHANLGGSSSRDVGDELPTATATATSAIFPAPGTRASLYTSAHVNVARGTWTQASLGMPGPSHASPPLANQTGASNSTQADSGLNATPRARTSIQHGSAGDSERMDVDMDVDATPRPARTQRTLYVNQSVGSERDSIKAIPGTEPVQAVDPLVQKNAELQQRVQELTAINNGIKQTLREDYEKELEKLRSTSNNPSANPLVLHLQQRIADLQASESKAREMLDGKREEAAHLKGRLQEVQNERTRLLEENARLVKEKENLVAAEASATQTLNAVKNVVSSNTDWPGVQMLKTVVTALLSPMRS
ncbi:hypothetical protein EVG20_g9120 [Dentipellis fragilis]|uniref:Uncharacterized protein n=1 Tax=Dentipellis fragilis TaxID=205917 RepID=A0A4Y9Y0F3_9AGAM|nr:hypothetical protein EVG20_g9120 [Dentipellis fragilis]